MSRSKVDVREVEGRDIDDLISNLRHCDYIELRDSPSPLSVPEVIHESVEMSTYCRTLTFDGELGCIFGVTPINVLSGLGAPWMLGTDLVERNAGAFIRVNRKYIGKIHDLYPKLINFVDVRNTTSIRWLKKMGFTFLDEPLPIGRNGHPFYQFTMGF